MTDFVTNPLPIMPTLKHLTLVCAGIAALATSLHVAAQQTAPVPPPPVMEKLEEGDDPAITIRKPSTATKSTEKRVQGKVTEVQVQAGGSNYIVKPNTPAGSALPGDAQSDTSRPAQWKVMEFGGPKPTNEADVSTGPQTLPPAPAAK